MPGLLLDVASYAHVDSGPGVFLIGHEADHSLDLAGGRPGLLYTRKRSIDELSTSLPDAVAGLVTAASVLEAEPALAGRVRLRTDALTLRLLDRLEAPNTDDTLSLVRDEVETLAAWLWPGAEVEVTRGGDARSPFTVHLSASEAPSLQELRQRTSAVAAGPVR